MYRIDEICTLVHWWKTHGIYIEFDWKHCIQCRKWNYDEILLFSIKKKDKGKNTCREFNE